MRTALLAIALACAVALAAGQQESPNPASCPEALRNETAQAAIEAIDALGIDSVGKSLGSESGGVDSLAAALDVLRSSSTTGIVRGRAVQLVRYALAAHAVALSRQNETTEQTSRVLESALGKLDMETQMCDAGDAVFVQPATGVEVLQLSNSHAAVSSGSSSFVVVMDDVQTGSKASGQLFGTNCLRLSFDHSKPLGEHALRELKKRMVSAEAIRAAEAAAAAAANETAAAADQSASNDTLATDSAVGDEAEAAADLMAGDDAVADTGESSKFSQRHGKPTLRHDSPLSAPSEQALEMAEQIVRRVKRQAQVLSAREESQFGQLEHSIDSMIKGRTGQLPMDDYRFRSARSEKHSAGQHEHRHGLHHHHHEQNHHQRQQQSRFQEDPAQSFGDPEVSEDAYESEDGTMYQSDPEASEQEAPDDGVAFSQEEMDQEFDEEAEGADGDMQFRQRHDHHASHHRHHGHAAGKQAKHPRAASARRLPHFRERQRAHRHSHHQKLRHVAPSQHESSTVASMQAPGPVAAAMSQAEVPMQGPRFVATSTEATMPHARLPAPQRTAARMLADAMLSHNGQFEFATEASVPSLEPEVENRIPSPGQVRNVQGDPLLSSILLQRASESRETSLVMCFRDVAKRDQALCPLRHAALASRSSLLVQDDEQPEGLLNGMAKAVESVVNVTTRLANNVSSGGSDAEAEKEHSLRLSVSRSLAPCSLSSYAEPAGQVLEPPMEGIESRPGSDAVAQPAAVDSTVSPHEANNSAPEASLNATHVHTFRSRRSLGTLLEFRESSLLQSQSRPMKLFELFRFRRSNRRATKLASLLQFKQSGDPMDELGPSPSEAAPSAGNGTENGSPATEPADTVTTTAVQESTVVNSSTPADGESVQAHVVLETESVITANPTASPVASAGFVPATIVGSVGKPGEVELTAAPSAGSEVPEPATPLVIREVPSASQAHESEAHEPLVIREVPSPSPSPLSPEEQHAAAQENTVNRMLLHALRKQVSQQKLEHDRAHDAAVRNASALYEQQTGRKPTKPITVNTKTSHQIVVEVHPSPSPSASPSTIPSPSPSSIPPPSPSASASTKPKLIPVEEDESIQGSVQSSPEPAKVVGSVEQVDESGVSQEELQGQSSSATTGADSPRFRQQVTAQRQREIEAARRASLPAPFMGGFGLM